MIWRKTRKKSLAAKAVLLLGMTPLLFSCAGSSFHYAPDSLSLSLRDQPLKIIEASDLHFLASSLTDDGALFTQTVDNADGKVTRYGEVVLDAFLEEVSQAKPDALFLSGDLTFNGEKASHEDLAKKLLPLRAKGIAVCLIPGNHDIDSSSAFSYSGDYAIRTDNVSKSAFLSIYQDLTFAHVLSFDETSLSYVYPLREDLWLLALSADGDSELAGRIPDSTLSWAASELELAKKQGIKVVGMTHESVHDQNPNFASFSLYNNDSVEALYQKEGVLANLSGHLHIQHYVEGESFPDFCTSSLLVSPSHYAEVTISPSSFAYSTASVDVLSYARKKDLTDPNLLSFPAYSEAYFKTSNEKKVRKRLEESTYTNEEKEAMVASYLALNYDYYAGVETDESLYPEGFELWRKSTLSSAAYVRTMLEDDQKNFNAYKKSLL